MGESNMFICELQGSKMNQQLQRAKDVYRSSITPSLCQTNRTLQPFPLRKNGRLLFNNVGLGFQQQLMLTNHNFDEDATNSTAGT
jgi:hypothetical protein